MDIPLAPVDIIDLDDLREDAEESQPAPIAAARPQPSGTRFGAAAADAMPDPMIPPTQVKPAYGLVGVPDQAITTRDVKVFSLGAILGVVVAYFGWGRSRSL